jgi:hypothetical protein
MRLEHGELGVPCEGGPAGEAVEGHGAERVDVGARVERTSFDLLGRGVVGGSEEEAGPGRRCRAHGLRKAEVAEIDVAVRLREEDVRRLHVPVHKPGRVGGIERASHLLDDANRLRDGELPRVPEELLQGRAAHVPHRDEQHAVHLVRVVHGDDVRMVE